MNHDFRLRARALLVALGHDPTPANLAKITPGENSQLATVNNMQYRILLASEAPAFIGFQLLENIRTLPAQYLAVFLQAAFPRTLPFEIVVQIADSLIKDDNPDAAFAIRKLIEFDQFFEQHVDEIVSKTGIQSLFKLDRVYRVEYQGKEFVIVESQIKPISDTELIC